MTVFVSKLITTRVSFRFYITLSGQKLTGREATRAAEEDKKVVKEGLGPAAKDRSTIRRSDATFIRINKHFKTGMLESGL